MANRVQDDDDVDAVYYAPGSRVLLNDDLVGRLHSVSSKREQWRVPGLVLFAYYNRDGGPRYRHGAAVLTCDGKIEKWGTTWLKRA